MFSFQGLYDAMEDIDQKWLNVSQYILNYNETLPLSRREEVAHRVKDHYLGPGGHFSNKTFDQFTQVRSSY